MLVRAPVNGSAFSPSLSTQRVKIAAVAMFNWVRKRWFRRETPSEIEQAQRLIAAVDRGGIPLNPARVNAIAQNLGLEVARRDPVEKTIQRIRACLQRL